MSQGLEILSSSRDLLSLPVEDDVRFCSLIDTRRISSTKMADSVSAHHEQALLTQQLANPANSWHFGFRRSCVSKQHIKGDRETALACQKVVLKCCGNELIESP